MQNYRKLKDKHGWQAEAPGQALDIYLQVYWVRFSLLQRLKFEMFEKYLTNSFSDISKISRFLGKYKQKKNLN
jgi:hypothetical protein